MRKVTGHWWVLLICGAAIAAIASGSRALAQRSPDASPADVLILNGKVYPANRQPFQQALAVRGNHIFAVGTSDELSRLRGAATQVVDAHGAAVVPGFNDVHTHILSGGLELDNVNLQGVQTLAAVQDRIRVLPLLIPIGAGSAVGAGATDRFPVVCRRAINSMLSCRIDPRSCAASTDIACG
jgi:hypothetical protein